MIREHKHGLSNKKCTSCKNKIAYFFDSRSQRKYVHTARNDYGKVICMSCKNKLQTHYKREVMKEFYSFETVTKMLNEL